MCTFFFLNETRLITDKAFTRIRRLVAGFLSQKPGFNFPLVLVDILAMRQVFFERFYFPLQVIVSSVFHVQYWSPTVTKSSHFGLFWATWAHCKRLRPISLMTSIARDLANIAPFLKCFTPKYKPLCCLALHDRLQFYKRRVASNRHVMTEPQCNLTARFCPHGSELRKSSRKAMTVDFVLEVPRTFLPNYGLLDIPCLYVNYFYSCHVWSSLLVSPVSELQCYI
jgi:hypothetical protein